jgi:hypothetical protein
MADEELLTVQGLAEWLKVPPSWVYAQTRCLVDPLPHFKMGKYLRFRRPEVALWMERRHRGRGKSPPTRLSAPDLSLTQ